MRRSETAWQTTWPGAMLNVDWEEEEGNCNLRDAVESRQIIVIRNNGRGSSFLLVNYRGSGTLFTHKEVQGPMNMMVMGRRSSN